VKVLSVERDQNVSGYTTYTVEAEDDPIPYLIQVHRLVGYEELWRFRLFQEAASGGPPVRLDGVPFFLMPFLMTLMGGSKVNPKGLFEVEASLVDFDLLLGLVRQELDRRLLAGEYRIGSYLYLVSTWVTPSNPAWREEHYREAVAQVGVRQALLTQELRFRLAHADTFSQEAITRAILLVWRERLQGALNRALGEPVP
jgi:hypothetical protein